MNSFNCSPFKSTKTEKIFVSNSLKKFIESPLSRHSSKDRQTAKQIWGEINKSHSHIFIFAFGGMSYSAKIMKSLFPSKNKNVVLIDKINEKYLQTLSSFKKTQLKACHFLFISKSGQTKEILFYKSFLKKIYSKKNLLLKGRITVLSQALKSPLLKWAKQQNGNIVSLNSKLPGRFSFFTLSGLMQSQAYDFCLNPKSLPPYSKNKKILEFFIHQYNHNKKEIFFCSFDPKLRELSHWLETSWSESLFHSSTQKQAPLLRHISLYDLRHSFIEELMAKHHQICFWALDLKSNPSSNEQQIKKLLKGKKIPYLFMKTSLNNKYLSHLITVFYKILFCMGDFLQLNIYKQNWVDHLKKISS